MQNCAYSADCIMLWLLDCFIVGECIIKSLIVYFTSNNGYYMYTLYVVTPRQSFMVSKYNS